MAIPEEKRRTLQDEWGLSPKLLDDLEAANAADAKKGQEAGIEQKEKDGEAPQEPQPEGEGETAEKPLTRQELGDVVTAIGTSLTALTQQIAALSGEVKELKEHKAAEDEETLADLFKCAIGHEQARLDGRKALAKSGPKETPAEDDEENTILRTGNPLVDNMVAGIVTGQFQQGLQQQMTGRQEEV